MATHDERPSMDPKSRVDFVEEAAPTMEELNPASAPLAAAMSKQKPKFWSRSMIRVFMAMTVGYLISTIQGYDGSLMGAINAMTPFHESFGLNGAGKSTGLVFIIYNIANVCAFPFCGFINDRYGRRVCMFIGCLVVLIGTAVQGPAQNLGTFMGGRFLLGFGAIIAHAAAPAYVVEIAPPAFRGATAGMYNNFWWVGNILAGWTTYGTNLNLNDSWAWRIPTIMQAFLPGCAMILIFFEPESPRWLISQDRTEEALDVLAMLHGDGDRNAPIVQLQYVEILQDREHHGAEHAWWDYRELVATRSARYRLGLVVACAFFGQWSGNNVVSYFMPAMVENAGITNTNVQLLINAINPIICWVAAMIGSTILDKFGRRTMMMAGLTGALIWYCFLTAFTAESSKNQSLSYGVIVSIYMFGICFAMGMTPSATLYPMEVLENHTRAKGSAVKYVFMSIATMTNTFGISVGIKEIGWKLYLVYIGWITVEITCIFFFFPETAGKTLEELTDIFESDNPRKASLEKKRLIINDGHVVRSAEKEEA